MPKRLTKEEIRMLYRKIHAGWYAAGLLALRDPNTRNEAVPLLRAELRRAGRHRQIRREGGFARGTKNKAWMDMPLPGDDTSGMVVAHGFDPMRDTPEGRKELLKREVLKAEQLDPETAALLPVLVKEGDAALRDMVESHKSFVSFIVLRYPIHTKGPDVLSDMIAAGMVGLWKAAQRYVQTENAKFTAYATHWIRSQIHVYYKKLLKIPPNNYKAIRRLENAYGELNQQLQREPTPAELAKAMGVLEERVHEIYKWRERLRSVRHLDIGEGTAVSGEPSPPKTNRQLQAALSDSLAAAGLNPIEQQLVSQAFGLPPYATDYSIQEIATRTNLDPKEIDKKIQNAMAKMRHSPKVLTILSEYRH